MACFHPVVSKGPVSNLLHAHGTCMMGLLVLYRVGNVDIGASSHKAFHDRQVAFVGGMDEWSVAMLVEGGEK